MRNADVHSVFREATYEFSFYADSILRNTEGLGPAIHRLLGLQRDGAQADVLAQTAATIDLAPPLRTSTRSSGRSERLTSACSAALRATTVARAPETPGYLYILTNPSLGNMVKVGKTNRSPRDRINELSAATGIPTPFVLAFDAYVEDCDAAEGYVHARLEAMGIAWRRTGSSSMLTSRRRLPSCLRHRRRSGRGDTVPVAGRLGSD